MSRYVKKSTWEAVKKRDRNKCVYCGKRKRWWQFWRKPLEKGHVIPYSSGGRNCYENIQVECFDCNRGKGSKYRRVGLLKMLVYKNARGCANPRCVHQ